MKTAKKKSNENDRKLFRVFKDVFPEAEAQKAMRDAKKAFRELKHDPLFFNPNREIYEA